jgi:uncharacterized protein
MLSLALISLLSATPPTPKDWVTDEADILTAPARARLDRRLESLEHTTGYEVLVWIGQSTGGEPIETFAERTFQEWKTERPRLDHGAILFVFHGDQTTRLQVGFGLAHVLTPEISARILNERIGPFLKVGEPQVALSSGLDAITTQLTGAPMPAIPAKDEVSSQQWWTMGVTVVGFVLILVVARVIRLPFLRRRRTSSAQM